MGRSSESRRRLKQAGLFASVIVLVVMAGASSWFVGYARIQPPLWTLALVLGWFAAIAIAVTSAFFLLRNWRNGDATACCPKCDYNLTGNESGHCPECGSPIPDGNQIEGIQDAPAKKPPRGTKVFLIYLAYVSIIIAVMGLCIWIVAHMLR